MMTCEEDQQCSGVKSRSNAYLALEVADVLLREGWGWRKCLAECRRHDVSVTLLIVGGIAVWCEWYE